MEMTKYLMRHVGDHGEHVIIGGSDEGGSEDNGQVSHLHLVGV